MGLSSMPSDHKHDRVKEDYESMMIIHITKEEAKCSVNADYVHSTWAQTAAAAAAASTATLKAGALLARVRRSLPILLGLSVPNVETPV